MRLRNRKSNVEQLLDAAKDSFDSLSGGLTRGKVVKASLIAAGLTAGSAAISSLRRRGEAGSQDS
jgi:hypothetical protein